MRKKILRSILCFAIGLGCYIWFSPPKSTWVSPREKKIPDTTPFATSIPTDIRDFAEAKKVAAVIYQDYPYTFYCGCHFTGKKVDHRACGYKPLHDTKRAHRIEWEHIVPAHAFGQAFAQWRNGASKCVHNTGEPYRGRACARLTSKAFKQMEADLYNLVPAIGEVNQLRADYPMGMLPGVAPMLGQCQTKIFHGIIEPRNEVRGFVARTYKYMDNRYPGFNLLHADNRAMMEEWDHTHPPNAFEIRRAKQIARIQGNVNPFVPRE